MPSENAVRAMTAPETDAVFLHLLTISVDGNVVLRLTDDKASVTSCGHEYSPCSFTVLLPDQGSVGHDLADVSVFH